jgi:hypothetical protein
MLHSQRGMVAQEQEISGRVGIQIVQPRELIQKVRDEHVEAKTFSSTRNFRRVFRKRLG